MTTLERLQRITKNCRADMHEPDEQGISATVVGSYLDNAFGDHRDQSDGTFGEFLVGLSNDGGKTYEWFNLANLIALARRSLPADLS